MVKLKIKSKLQTKKKLGSIKKLSPAQYGKTRNPQISRQRVLQYINSGRLEGCISRTDNGRYEIDKTKADEALASSLNQMHTGRQNDPTSTAGGTKGQPKGKGADAEDRQAAIDAAGFGGLSYREAQTEKERWTAALRRLEYDEKRGALIERAEVRMESHTAGTLIKEKLSSIPGRLGAMAAAESDPFACEQMLKVEINQILEDLSIELERYE